MNLKDWKEFSKIINFCSKFTEPVDAAASCMGRGTAFRGAYLIKEAMPVVI